MKPRCGTNSQQLFIQQRQFLRVILWQAVGRRVGQEMVKAQPVKPVQSLESADPQIAKPVLNNGGDAIVAEAILHVEVNKALLTPVACMQRKEIEQAYKHDICAFLKLPIWNYKAHRF